ncbi:MAG: GDSL-type esterase/lipase family protein [Parvibaculaceae bacterium]|nr:GDSL-type esterase/lipase family protein [Parvibaculaceae bacterium]
MEDLNNSFPTLLVISLTINVLVIGLALYGLSQIPKVMKSFVGSMTQRQKDSWAASKLNSADIVFLGDSITHEGSWEEYFLECRAVNRGINGDTVQGVIDRLPDVFALNPQKIFLLIGVNDLNNHLPIERLKATYDDLFDKLNTDAPNTEIFLQSILPVKDKLHFGLGAKNKDILVVNSFLKTQAAHHGFTFIDTHSLFENEQGVLRPDLSNDGLHLCGQGYAQWRDAISQFVQIDPV